MTSDPFAELQYGILPLFRTRASDMWNWRVVDDYVGGAQQGIDDFAAAARVHGAGVVVPYVRKAIASTFRVLMRADDSNGGIQLVIDELLGLHARLCLIEPPDTAKLVAWLEAFQFGEAGEYFRIDVIDYAIALGLDGLDRYRRRLARREAALSHPFVRGPQAFVNDDEWATRHTLLHNYRRLAVLDRDEQELVALYTGEHEHARDLLEGADALVEARFPERAIELVYRGMRATGSPFDQRTCADRWLDLLEQQHPSEVRAAAEEVFGRWATAAHARRWESAVGAQEWAGMREAVLDRLRPVLYELIPYLLDAGDVPRAWQEAHRAAEEGRPPSMQLWDAVVDAYRRHDPAAVLPVMEAQLYELLKVADTRVYPKAVKRMKELLLTAQAAGIAADGERMIRDLREKYRRRPSLIERMDRARLPR